MRQTHPISFGGGGGDVTSQGILGTCSDVTTISHHTQQDIAAEGISSSPWMPTGGDYQCSIFLNAENQARKQRIPFY